jgi:hypothetical protein
MSMSIPWTMTFDAAEPGRVGRFWMLALGYVPRPVPAGFASWDAWFEHYNVPEDERDEASFLVDPDGQRPSISILKVPEPKVAKNRLHLDVQIGGGRYAVPWEERWPRVEEMVRGLVAAGGTVLQLHELDGRPDHYVMADPEGNEFCVL